MSDGLELLKPFLPGLEDVLEDPEVSEIMINGPQSISRGRSVWTRPLRPLSMPAWRTARGWQSACHRRALKWRSLCGDLANGHSRPRTW